MFEYNTLEQAFSLNWIYFKPQSSLKYTYTQLSENACSRVYTSILTWLGIFERVKKYFIHIFTWLRYFSKKAQLSEKACAYLLCNILGIKLQNFSLNWITYPFTTLIRLKIKYIIKQTFIWICSWPTRPTGYLSTYQVYFSCFGIIENSLALNDLYNK